jgi:hypothetical protein
MICLCSLDSEKREGRGRRRRRRRRYNKSYILFKELLSYITSGLTSA